MEFLKDNSLIHEIIELDTQISKCNWVRSFNDYKTNQNLYIKELNEQQVDELSIIRKELFLANYDKKSQVFRFDLIAPEDLIHEHEKELLVYLKENKSNIEKSELCDFLFIESLSKNKLSIIDFYIDNKKNIESKEENIKEMIKRITAGDCSLFLSILNKKQIWNGFSFNNKKHIIKAVTVSQNNTNMIENLINKEKELSHNILYDIFSNACLNGNEETMSFLYNYNHALLDIKNESLWKLYEDMLENKNQSTLKCFLRMLKDKYNTLDIFYQKSSLLSLSIRKKNNAALKILLEEGANPLISEKKCKNAVNTFAVVLSKNGESEKLHEMKLILDKYILNKHIEEEIITSVAKVNRI